MRHRIHGRKLGRTSAHRKAMFRNMAASLVKYEIIQTTDQKAKELRSIADHLITLAKQDTVHAQRQAFKVLNDRDLVYKLFHDLGKREAITSRNGGYTRIIKLKNRQNDNALISRISWVGATLENTAKLRYPPTIYDRLFKEDGDTSSSVVEQSAAAGE